MIKLLAYNCTDLANKEGELSSYSHRTHTCGELGAKHIGQEVTLCGWLQYQRNKNFYILRDWHGITQAYVEKNDIIDKLYFESVIKLKGEVRVRVSPNKEMKTGEIEVLAKEIEILNPAKQSLPFEVKDNQEHNEVLRLQHRYLDIRKNSMQRNLRMRSQVLMKIREFLCTNHNFVDVETPTLFKRTSGGAQEFVVPTQTPGAFYSLPQSPQQFKQLLMAGGIDRYFQIARCYRDESLGPERQPEFTQVDIEMSFTDQEKVRKLIEDMLVYSWPLEEIQAPFQRFTYDEAMTMYGTDKPDARFDFKIQDVTDVLQEKVELFRFIETTPETDKSKPSAKNSIQIIVVPQTADRFTNSQIQNYDDMKTWSSTITRHIDPDALSSICNKCDVKPNDIVFISSGQEYQPHAVLGKIRLLMADLLESRDVVVRDLDVYQFLWIYDFPLFCPKEDGSGLDSSHHPFTAPVEKDKELLKTDPLKAKGQHYDLVVNGVEIGGGSMRIHNSELQKFVLDEILKEDSTEFQHLLEALASGCPPHGGIALGFDRLMSLICKTKNIRDVIAFPKSSEGKDLMSGAPSQISRKDLDNYHISVKDY
ncbi:hypothetical protein LOTGIDRAFT_177302 [Lottia gigantea]|uniref:Aminoacyl-transfer RNA synthetases class-II family profile domain-containing protein n=1 Tax=Lottia gigantea TaxID=225164 RepID=V4AAZ6_LOTGI|nr:hypothetical protein LOTGIDRAFT_177302 [Lottia gigantea]ESO93957.1 hypothetical protein LOTGIDRAFT_177302 [Lottia gigantea]